MRKKQNKKCAEVRTETPTRKFTLYCSSYDNIKPIHCFSPQRGPIQMNFGVVGRKLIVVNLQLFILMHTLKLFYKYFKIT